MLYEFPVQTNSRTEFVDITHLVRKAVAESGVDEGIAVVYVPHTTAGVTVNEHADPDVARDMIMELNKMVPFDDGYRHLEGNSAAHIKATLTGSSGHYMITEGKLLLGTWQGVYFCEYDGPRRRKVYIKVLK